MKETKNSKLKIFGREAAVIGSYTLLALIFTFPLILHFGDSVPGENNGDAWQMVWNLWWVRYALENGQNVFQTNLIFYPDGADLHLHALNALNGLISLPVQYLADWLGGAASGAVAAYNFIVFFSLVMSAYGGFCLARYLWGDWRAALLAGLGYGFCTYHFSHLLGHLNLISSEFIPFYILFLIQTLQGFSKPRDEDLASPSATNQPEVVVAPSGKSKTGFWRPSLRGRSWRWLAAALSLVAITFLELQYILYLALFTAFYLLYIILNWLLARWQSQPTLLKPKRIAVGSFLIGATYSLLSLPFTLPILLEALTNPNTVPRRQEREYSADLLAYFYPSPFHPLWGKAMDSAIKPFTATLIEKVVFPGFTLYLLALAGLVAWGLARFAKKSASADNLKLQPALKFRPAVGFWLIMALVFAVFSFGPELHINGKATGIGLPGSFIYSTPILNISRVPSRFAVIAILAFAVLAAWGLACWRNRLSGRFYSALVVVSFVALAFELLPAPYRYATYQVPEFYQQLADDPRKDYAILDVPLNYGRYQYTTDYLKEQMTHRKPLINGYISRNPIFAPYYGLPVFLEFRDFLTEPQADILPAQAPNPAILRYFNVRYISIHKDILPGGEQARAFSYLAKLLPGANPVADSAELAVFEVPPGPKADFFYNVVQTGWHQPEKTAEGKLYRWLNGSTGALDFWTQTPRQIELEFSSFSFQEAHDLEILLNGRSLYRSSVPLEETPIKLRLALVPGQNSLVFRVGGKIWRPNELDKASQDSRPLNVGITALKITGLP